MRAFGNPENCAQAGVKSWLQQLNKIQVSSFQALLFGRDDVHLFRDDASREALSKCLNSYSQVAQWTGATAMVFGSPANRKRGNMDEITARDIAQNFFREVGTVAHRCDTTFALEPNPPDYGCDFLTNFHDTADFVRAVANPGIVLNLDCGELIMNSVALDQTFTDALSLVGHVHVSLPFLAPISSVHPLHDAVLKHLENAGYEKFVTIEMKRPPGGISEVIQAVKVVQSLLPA